jgi:two-component system cell cycle sensor histidine kinase/response regulator CckA
MAAESRRLAGSDAEHRPLILVVDDDKLQLKLSTIRLQDAGFSVDTASSAVEALQVAAERVPDVILSDVLMGEVDGFGLCRRLREIPELAAVPIVLASAHYADVQAQELATRVGASRLIGRSPEFEAELSAIRGVLASPKVPEAVNDREVYEQHLRTNADQLSRLVGEAKDAEVRYRALFDGATDPIAVLDRAATILEANPRWRPLLGLEPQSMVGKHLLAFSPQGRAMAAPELSRAIEQGSGVLEGVPIERPDGGTAYVDFSIFTVEIGDRQLVFAIGRDVTGRFLAARALVLAEEKYRSLVERLPDVVMTWSRRRCVFVTNNVEAVTGFAPSEVYALSMQAWLDRVHPADDERVQAHRDLTRPKQNKLFDHEYRWRRKDGRWIWLHHRVIAAYERAGEPYADALLTDITQRKQLEESLHHSQKMEAIGQLSGGIAHDFNNILATVLANSQFLLDALDVTDKRIVDAQEIKLAAERAMGLTRQLLAFSRRQVLELRVTDLNRVIADLERMLRRLIGEDIELEVAPGIKLGNVNVDPGQIEQVLLNLAVNARDAMPSGGRLRIETGNIQLDAELQARHGVPPGDYVYIAMSDTGVGMDPITQRRIFEPFFTTKPPGKGSGLGLATSHGIVAQCGGTISVFSELGHGSVFKVYLPRVDAVPEENADGAALVPPGGNELLLLVEDDLPLRSAVQRMLVTRGYRIIAARDTSQAVQLARAHSAELALLISDVIMPQMSGPAVAEAVREWVPNVRVLFMSGYTDHAVLSEQVLKGGSYFIQKPFSSDALALKIREALDR